MGPRRLGAGDLLRRAAGRIAVGEQVIVADGVRSTLGKKLGREWHRDTAFGVAARAYVPSTRADDNWMGSHLELRAPDGELLPGYGWLFPLGGAAGCLTMIVVSLLLSVLLTVLLNLVL